jgi:hypothetical protein
MNSLLSDLGSTLLGITNIAEWKCRNYSHGYYFITLDGRYQFSNTQHRDDIQEGIDKYIDYEKYKFIYPGMSKKELLCKYSYNNRHCLVTDFPSYNYVINQELIPMSTDEYQSLKKEILEFLFDNDKKIHLQPQESYLLFVMTVIVDLIRSGKLKGLYRWKVIDKIVGNRLPTIVIYPYYGKFDETFTTIKHALSPFSELAGSDITPRFNKKIDNLIYVSGGDGDIKERYGSELDIFDKDLIFYRKPSIS